MILNKQIVAGICRGRRVGLRWLYQEHLNKNLSQQIFTCSKSIRETTKKVWNISKVNDIVLLSLLITLNILPTISSRVSIVDLEQVSVYCVTKFLVPLFLRDYQSNTSQSAFICSRLTIETLDQVWNIVQVNNNETKTMPLALFWCYYC